MQSQTHISSGTNFSPTVMGGFLRTQKEDERLADSTPSITSASWAALVALNTSVATFIPPIIPTSIVTEVIAAEVSSNSYRPEGYLPKQVKNSSIIDKLSKAYTVSSSVVVGQYLTNNQDLIETLNTIPAQLANSPSVKAIELELYQDIEENWEKLFVMVTTITDDIDKLDRMEDELFTSLFQPHMEQLAGRLVLSVR